MVIQKQWIGECSGCRIEFKVKVIKGQGQFDKRLGQGINYIANLLFTESPPFLRDIIFMSRKHSLLYCIYIIYLPVMVSMKKKNSLFLTIDNGK